MWLWLKTLSPQNQMDSLMGAYTLLLLDVENGEWDHGQYGRTLMNIIDH